MSHKATATENNKTLGTVAWCLVIVAVLLAAVFAFEKLSSRLAVSRSEALVQIHLSQNTKSDSDDVRLTPELLAAWSSPYSALRSSVMYEALNESEQTVYRAMEYALYQGYTYVCVDDALVNDRETLIKVLRYLALDSPLLEQNLRYSASDFSYVYEVDVLGLYTVDATLTGYYIRVDNFTEKLWKKKMLALDKARALVAALPKNATSAEKAITLYKTVSQGVEYTEYSSKGNGVQTYLYDALLAGKTNCDGYANALALVLRLAGIESLEKNYIPETDDETGHTWTCFELDGKWYNADATGEAYIPKEALEMQGGLRCGFPDILQRYVPAYAEVYPRCEEALCVPVDAHIQNNLQLTEALVDGFSKHGNRWALVLVDTVDRTTSKNYTQQVANRLHIRFQVRYIQTVDGRTAVFAYTAL